MGKIKSHQFREMTDMELVSYAFKEIEKFRMISGLDDFEKLRRAMFILDPLIVELKNRHIDINEKFFADKVLIKD